MLLVNVTAFAPVATEPELKPPTVPLMVPTCVPPEPFTATAFNTTPLDLLAKAAATSAAVAFSLAINVNPLSVTVCPLDTGLNVTTVLSVNGD